MFEVPLRWGDMPERVRTAIRSDGLHRQQTAAGAVMSGCGCLRRSNDDFFPCDYHRAAAVG